MQQPDLGIDQDQLKAITSGLSRTLADSYTLYVKTHNFHWNVTGPMFFTLHNLFEEQYTELATAIDTIAERIRALGARAPGSFREFSELTSIEEASGTPNAHEMVQQLIQSHETLIRNVRELVPIASEAKDTPTEDLLIARLQIHEKSAWMLRSLLEG